MSSIFNLFGGNGGSTQTAKQQSMFGPTESSVESTIFGNARAAPGKNALLTPSKPKGLSMRSNSEINVGLSNRISDRSPRKKSPNKALAKAYLGVSESVSLPLSPRSKSSKLEVIKSKQQKALSSKSRSPINNLTNEKQQSEETTFRKPLAYTSKRAATAYPKPDALAFHYDDRSSFECTIDKLDREFVEFLIASNRTKIQPYEDEGFESDPELISPPIPDINNSIEDISVKEDSIELPEISDDDDFLD